jgi:hypothetical protein
MNLRNLLTNDASYKNLFMDLRKLKKLEYSFWWDNQTVKNMDKPCVYRKVSGSGVIFLILYLDDILLIENDIYLL